MCYTPIHPILPAPEEIEVNNTIAGAAYRIVENEIHESINARTESLQALRELGPPDLVHLIKTQPKAAVKEVRRTSCVRHEAPAELTLIISLLRADRHLSSRHRCRCFVVGVARCLHQYPDILDR